MRTKHLPAVVVLAAAALAAAVRAGAAPAPHPVGVDDLFGVREAHDPRISPDSRFVAYTLTSTSLEKDATQTRVFMIPTDGGDAVALTTPGETSEHPRWSPDGRFLAFLSSRDEGKVQVYLLNRLGGEAEELTDTPQDVEDFAWSPDGRRLVLVLRDPSREEIEAAAAKGKGEAKVGSGKPKARRPWVIDRLQFKEDEIGYLDRRRTHLYVFDLAGRTMRQVTSGDYDDDAPAWSPDGRWLAFASNRSQPDPDATYDSDIWVVDADNTDRGAHPRAVTTGPADEREPTWSPDGRWIAYTTQLDPKLFWYGTRHVAVSPAGGGEGRVLTRALDRMASSPRFAADGRSIDFIADDDGTLILARVGVSDGQVARPIDGRLSVESYTVGPDGTIAASVSTMDRPYEIFTVRSGRLAQLTRANDAWLETVRLARGEYVSFPSRDGTIVHGYVYRPLDAAAGRPYPAILRPHGGPVWAYYSEYQDLAQLLAANGYVVLLPNPRGSSGYGEDFCKAIYADWGNKDFQDDMAMVDWAIAQGLVDPDRLGVGGWSYGGISTDFIIAQTDRFKGAISGAGAAAYRALWGHDQYQRDYTIELGLPWEHPETWDRVNYLKKVERITTPTMFMGGAIDWNVPILGGEQMYQSLRALGRDTLLVVYPDEYHEFKTPSHIRDRFQRYLAWWGHYVKGDAAPARPPEEPVPGSEAPK